MSTKHDARQTFRSKNNAMPLALTHDRSGFRGSFFFQQGQPGQRMTVAFTAHFSRRLKAGTHRWPLGSAKQQAQIVSAELNAAHPGRLALRHARDGGGNGGCDATGSAMQTTIHDRLSTATGNQGRPPYHKVCRLPTQLTPLLLQIIYNIGNCFTFYHKTSAAPFAAIKLEHKQ
ncbi:hypothetical protein [Aquitalea aquatica]|uniref:Uncharacterized protein n=1 Tax=Aquitalea aquatica TaxID=3044273 RepID=A0A838Y369_9NEIS|nr:hypothetical protein [Aquitalea magnusonii]MBA4708318.1 hypothetical protein [Aquitalea magnusonii]